MSDLTESFKEISIQTGIDVCKFVLLKGEKIVICPVVDVRISDELDEILITVSDTEEKAKPSDIHELIEKVEKLQNEYPNAEVFVEMVTSTDVDGEEYIFKKHIPGNYGEITIGYDDSDDPVYCDAYIAIIWAGSAEELEKMDELNFIDEDDCEGGCCDEHCNCGR
jgi:hypothetical protein